MRNPRASLANNKKHSIYLRFLPELHPWGNLPNARTAEGGCAKTFFSMEELPEFSQRLWLNLLARYNVCKYATRS